MRDYTRINLDQDKYTLVDARDSADFLLRKYTWTVHTDPATRDPFAARTDEDGQLILLHRLIMGLEPWETRQCEHRHHNTLDNRYGSLIYCRDYDAEKLIQEEIWEATLHNKNASTVRGWQWNHQRGKYFATLRVEYRARHLGSYDSPQEARDAWRAAKAEAGAAKAEEIKGLQEESIRLYHAALAAKRERNQAPTLPGDVFANVGATGGETVVVPITETVAPVGNVFSGVGKANRAIQDILDRQ